MIRYGTIGTNFIVDRFQEAAMENPGLHYSAVYSRNQETAGNFAAKYGVETTYTDLNAFACADDLDAVYIASPNSFHYEQAALLLSHGKHVLCEKPVTSNARELEHLIQLAGQNNVILLEAIRSIFTPGYQALAKHLPKLGTIRRASFHFCQYSSRYDKFKSGIVENAFNPIFSNGALMDIGVYCVHPLVRLFGMPEKSKQTPSSWKTALTDPEQSLACTKICRLNWCIPKSAAAVFPARFRVKTAPLPSKESTTHTSLFFMTEPAADRSCTRVLPRRTCPVR